MYMYKVCLPTVSIHVSLTWAAFPTCCERRQIQSSPRVCPKLVRRAFFLQAAAQKASHVYIYIYIYIYILCIIYMYIYSVAWLGGKKNIYIYIYTYDIDIVYHASCSFILPLAYSGSCKVQTALSVWNLRPRWLPRGLRCGFRPWEVSASPL